MLHFFDMGSLGDVMQFCSRAKRQQLHMDDVHGWGEATSIREFVARLDDEDWFHDGDVNAIGEPHPRQRILTWLHGVLDTLKLSDSRLASAHGVFENHTSTGCFLCFTVSFVCGEHGLITCTRPWWLPV